MDRYYWAYQLTSGGYGGLVVPEQIHQVLVPRLAARLEPSEVAECFERPDEENSTCDRTAKAKFTL